MLNFIWIDIKPIGSVTFKESGGMGLELIIMCPTSQKAKEVVQILMKIVIQETLKL